jgi:hypothetical protein
MPSEVRIDLISYDPMDDEFALYLLEDGPWPQKGSAWKKCLSRIQSRVFDAIDTAVDGHLASRYPDSSGKKVRVQVDSPQRLPLEVSDLIARIREHIAKDNVYKAAIARSPFIKGLRITTGHEMGRFGGLRKSVPQ